ncbi:uncharacterized protein LOC112504242 [Cynara cardunculus var. scolymus]|uniref:uncharacterized protein LOC112504242 n=1 Tax=Cynara cardunculus var. scolymus TaxID=59895 RepID=UPI000D6300E5|nr:uncharacterized protein LOC112504242 [Cynara cardunculus var. scolymus]
MTPSANYAGFPPPGHFGSTQHPLNYTDPNNYFDTGAEQHVTDNRGSGTGFLPIYNRNYILPNILYSPQIIKNLLSVRVLTQHIYLTASSDTFLQEIINKLSREFAMTDLGQLHHFLGLQVTCNSHGLFLDQSQYAKEIISRASMSSCKPCTTPVDLSAKLSATDGDLFSDPTLYRSLAGALQYLTFTRPDTSYVVQQVCLFMHEPRDPHYAFLKRILRYLQGTLDYGIRIVRSNYHSLTAYSDADWGPTVSRSSAEAEYRGVANAVAEATWIRNLLLELHIPLRQASVVYCDNVSAVYLSNNPVQHQRTKHIEIDIHFVREKVKVGHPRVLHVPSSLQYADIFTNSLSRQLFQSFRSSLSVCPLPTQTAGES